MSKRRFHSRRRAYADDATCRRAEGFFGDRSRRHRVEGGARTHGHEARVDRPRRVRQRAAEQRRRALRRASRRAQGGRAAGSAGADREPAVRLRHPGRDERRAADSTRRGGLRARRRHGEHEPGAAHHSRPARRPEAGAGQARRLVVGRPERSVRRLLDGDHRRELRRQIRHHARGVGRLRAAQPAARAQGVDLGDHEGRSGPG